MIKVIVKNDAEELVEMDTTVEARAEMVRRRHCGSLYGLSVEVKENDRGKLELKLSLDIPLRLEAMKSCCLPLRVSTPQPPCALLNKPACIAA